MTPLPSQPTDGAKPSADGVTAGLASPLAEALTRASWRLKRTSLKELAPLGLTFAQSRVLRILARRGEPVRIGDIATRFEVAPRSATSMIDSLETMRLVERRADPTDRRSVLVGLTPGPRPPGAHRAPRGAPAPRPCSAASRRASSSTCSTPHRAERAGRGVRRARVMGVH